MAGVVTSWKACPSPKPIRSLVGSGSQIDGPAVLGSPSLVTSARSPSAAGSGESQASTVNSVPVAAAPFSRTSAFPAVGKDRAVPEACPTRATSGRPHRLVGSATAGRVQEPGAVAYTSGWSVQVSSCAPRVSNNPSAVRGTLVERSTSWAASWVNSCQRKLSATWVGVSTAANRPWLTDGTKRRFWVGSMNGFPSRSFAPRLSVLPAGRVRLRLRW